jgi:hypothetical protein
MPYVVYRQVSDGYDYYMYVVKTFKTKESAESFIYHEEEYGFPNERYVIREE